MVNSLELLDQNSFFIWMGLGIGATLFLYFVGFWFRPQTEKILYGTIQSTYDHVMPIFFDLDGQKVEKLGIGKIQEIMIKGINVWGELIYKSIYDGLGVIIIIVSSLIIVFSQNFKIGFLGGVIIILFILWILARYRGEKYKRHQAKNDDILVSQGMIR